MRIFFNMTNSYFRTYLSKKSFWCYLLLLPIIVGILLFWSQNVDGTKVAVGVAFVEDGEIEERIASNLLAYETIAFEIVELDDIYNDVRVGRYDIGYIIQGDLEENIENIDMENAVEVIMIEDNIYSTFVQESIFQALYTELISEIAEEVLSSRNLIVSDEELQSCIDYYMDSEYKFTVEVQYVENVSVDTENEQSEWLYSLLKSILCIYLFLIAMISAIYSQTQKKNMLSIYIGHMPVKLYTILPIHISVMLSVLISVAMVHGYIGSTWSAFLVDLLTIILYECTLLFGTLSLVELVKKEWILLVLPYMIISIFLTHPILWDVTRYFSQVKWVLNWCPTYCFFEIGRMNFILCGMSIFVWIILHIKDKRTIYHTKNVKSYNVSKTKGGMTMKKAISIILIVFSVIGLIANGVALYFLYQQSNVAESLEILYTSNEDLIAILEDEAEVLDVAITDAEVEIEEIVAEQEAEAAAAAAEAQAAQEAAEAAAAEAAAKAEEEAAEAAEIEAIHSYYYFIADVTWEEAQERAYSLGGYLVNINSQEEFDYIVTELEQSSDLASTQFMLGGTRESGSMSYYWMDKEGSLSGDVINSNSYWANDTWYTDEPSFLDGSIQEDCMNMYFNTTENRWVFNDVPNDILEVVPDFSGRIGYIIEVE